MSRVIVNLTEMFGRYQPWDCSNSQANLGDQCARLTWHCAMEVAENHSRWLLSALPDALEYIQGWALECGAWDRDEVEAWTDQECLALLVQNFASDARELGSDDQGLDGCAVDYEHSPGLAERVTCYPYIDAKSGHVHAEVCR